MYALNGIEKGLTSAAFEYCSKEVSVDASARVVTLPALLQHYASDFLSSTGSSSDSTSTDRALLVKVCEYLKPLNEKQGSGLNTFEQLSIALRDPAPLSIIFADYIAELKGSI